MKDFDEKILKDFLKNCKNFCVLCIGNPLRGDDGVGIEIGKILRKHLKNVLIAETDPTVYLSKLRKFDGIIVIDSARMNCNPGEVKVLEKEELKDFLHTTHDIPLKVLLDILSDKKIMIIGIEPENTGFGDEISRKIKEASEKVLKTILKVLKVI